MSKRIIAVLMVVAGVAYGSWQGAMATLWTTLEPVGEDFPTDGLVAYWSMDSVSGTTVFDDYGTNNATARGTYSFGSVESMNGDSVLIERPTDDTSQGVLVSAPNADLSHSNMTVSAWVRDIQDQIQWRGIVSKTDGNWARGWGLYYNSSTSVRFFAGNYTSAGATASITQRKWTHIVGVVTAIGEPVLLYVDGELAATGQNATSTLLTSTAIDSQYIGATGSGLAYGARGVYIDEVAIWNRALSSNEVSEIYNNGVGKFYTP
jgi:hypothetical protein